jgi:hypothetical protein
MARVVEAVAVELDREPVLGPATVDPAATRRAVGNGKPEAIRVEELQEPALQGTEGDVDVSLDDPPEPAGAGDVGSLLELRGDLGRGGPMEHARLVAGTGEGLHGEN